MSHQSRSHSRPRTPRRSTLIAVALASALLLPACQLSSPEHAQPHAGNTLMLIPENAGGETGTIDRTELLVAYGKSAYLKDHYTTLESARDVARDAGDTELAARIEAEGPAWQDVLHRQLAGDEPLTTIVLEIQVEMREVADAHHVSRIVEAGPNAKGIDLTPDLVAALEETNQ